MAKVAITEQYLTDIADAIRNKTGMSTETYYPSEMADAILTISGGGGITPTGTISITENGTYNVTTYASASVSVPSSTINNQNKTVDPGTSQKTVTYDSGYTGLGTVTINAMPAGTAGTPTASKGAVSNNSISVTPSVTNITGYITGSTKTGTAVTVSASELVSGNKSITANGTNIDVTNYATVSVAVPTGGTVNNQDKTVNPSTSTQEITYDSGYTGLGTVTVNAMPTLSLPTSAAASATSGYTSKATISRSTSDQYINIGTGYNSAGAYYKISAVANGSATGPSSLSGSSATVSTGTNTLTLTKTGVTTTPTVSAGYVSSATASTATVTLTASVTTKAAATITPGTSNQTINSGTYLTGTQTISGDVNLIAGNIKKNVSIFGVTGSYEGSGGGGSSVTIATATKTLSSAASSIQFTSLAGEPTSFVVTSSSDQSTGGTKVVTVVYDGTSCHGADITTQVTADTGFTQSYSNGTLTITATTASFQANTYKLVYSYGGTSSNIGTEDIQVGSGATSITFTGLSAEPEYFSCIFKSNFSTSSGYQRVIDVVYDGTSTYGHAFDSSAKAQTSWSYSYNNGSLVITSTGTNNGGYFHQPGYYQLTYAIGGDSTLQKKTVTPTSSDQTITADTAQGYTALSQVEVEGIVCENLIAGNIKSGVTVKIGTDTDDDSVTSVTGTYDAGGSSKNVQVLQSTTRINASSLTKALGDLTVSKSGTYDIYWSGGRTNTSTSYTWGTQLYIGSTAYGSENTTWTNNVQSNHLTNVSLTANQKLSVYARGRTGSYYTFVPMLTIVEV